MKKAVIKNKSSVTIHGLKPGATTRIEVDRGGTPVDRTWRRRVADSKMDGAIVITNKETRKHGDDNKQSQS